MMKKQSDKKELQTTIKISKEMFIYNSPDGNVKVDVLLQDENIWLPQDKIGELFGIARNSVSTHLKNIFNDNEIDQESNVKKIDIANSDKPVKYYNLDCILAVGYRTNSHRAIMFRKWATQILKEYVIKGSVLDDERLKIPNRIFGKDYFDETLARIKDIRSSERRFYQKITDIYIQCSADYSVDAEITKNFFATVQNKLHWAISHQTAAEIVYGRADAKKDNMGLTSWKNSPKGLIRKSDVSIAKNYLNKKELTSLNRIVSMYLDYAEEQTENFNVMYMENWVEKLDAFLQFNRKDILDNLGKVSHEIAKAFAEKQFEIYNIKQIANYQSDFDELLKKANTHNEGDNNNE
jgi:hypothetical protein